jgi:hypothetical protein
MNNNSLKNPLISREITTTFTYRLLYVSCSSILIFVIPLSLSDKELGYYFTFSSITALQIFFELGLSFVFLQFFSHEKAKLSIDAAGCIYGDPNAISKIKFYFDFLIKWYLVSCILFLCIVPALGIFFFCSQGNLSVEFWILPWITLCVFTSFNIFLSAIISMFEGLGFLSEIAITRSFNVLTSFVASTMLIFFDIGLYIVIFVPLCTFLFYSHWIFKKKNILLSIYRSKKPEVINWRNDIFPYQWRISASWLSGYFIFNALNPYIFYKYGSEIAGKTGFCLSLFSAALTISSTWINASIPQLNQLISAGNKTELNEKYSKYLFLSIATYLTIFSGLLSLKIFSDSFHYVFSTKTIDIVTFILIGIIYLIHLISGNLATYVRSHLVEPFVFISILSALSFTLIAALNLESVQALFINFNIISFIGLIYIFYHFIGYYSAERK